MRHLLLYSFIFLIVLLRVLLTPNPQPFPDGTHLQAKARLTATPVQSHTGQQLTVAIEGRKVRLFVPHSSSYTYGQLLRIDGTIRTKVLDNGGIVSSISYPKITIVEDDLLLPFSLAGWVRERVESAFRKSLPPDHVSLLLGVVFGINRGFSEETKTAFQAAGVMHVIAASGMNVTLLGGFLLPLFTRVLKRQQAVVAVICLLLFYTVLSGMSPSIVRATLMACIALVGLLLGRQRTSLLGLYLTGCLMLIFSPQLLTDIGFQLSFSATAGIILLSQPLSRIGKQWLPVLVREDLTTTLAAQIATLPLLLFYFHSVGILSIVVNLLVLWTVPPIMIIGSIAGLLALVSGFLGSIVAFLAEPLLIYFLLIVRFFGSVTPMLTITVVPASLVIAYYLLLLSFILSSQRSTT